MGGQNEGGRHVGGVGHHQTTQGPIGWGPYAYDPVYAYFSGKIMAPSLLPQGKKILVPMINDMASHLQTMEWGLDLELGGWGWGVRLICLGFHLSAVRW